MGGEAVNATSGSDRSVFLLGSDSYLLGDVAESGSPLMRCVDNGGGRLL